MSRTSDRGGLEGLQDHDDAWPVLDLQVRAGDPPSGAHGGEHAQQRELGVDRGPAAVEEGRGHGGGDGAEAEGEGGAEERHLAEGDEEGAAPILVGRHLGEGGDEHVADRLAELRGGDVGEVVREVVDARGGLPERAREEEVVPAPGAEAGEGRHRHGQAEGEELARAGPGDAAGLEPLAARGHEGERDEADGGSRDRGPHDGVAAAPGRARVPRGEADRQDGVDDLAERSDEAHLAEAHVPDEDPVLYRADALEHGGDREAREEADHAGRADEGADRPAGDHGERERDEAEDRVVERGVERGGPAGARAGDDVLREPAVGDHARGRDHDGGERDLAVLVRIEEAGEHERAREAERAGPHAGRHRPEDASDGGARASGGRASGAGLISRTTRGPPDRSSRVVARGTRRGPARRVVRVPFAADGPRRARLKPGALRSRAARSGAG